MDLNIIVNDCGQIASEFYIQKRLDRTFQDRIKTVALSTIIEGDKVKNVPKPLKVVCENSNIKILNRLTVKVTQNMQIFNLQKNENFKNYDILAIEPLNEQILNKINSGDINCDIMTFSTPELSKVIKKSNFAVTIQHDVGIEINYGGLLSSSSDRRQTIALGQLLVDKTRAKNIILSSGTRPEMTSKMPEDILAISYLFGLEKNQGCNALFTMTQKVVKRSELRRNIVTSIIKIENKVENKQKDDKQCNQQEAESQAMKRKLSDLDTNDPKKVKC